MTTDRFIPPAAEGLPLAALDSATEGANRLDAWALDPRGRNFLAHALVQLARDGWLRTKPAVSPVPPPEQCPNSEFDGYGLQCQKPAGHNLCTFEEEATTAERPAVGEQPETQETSAPVHAIPLPGSNGISSCCGRPPCEFVGERVTRDPDEVTCRGPE